MRSLSEFILSRAGRTRDERLVWFVEIAVVVLGIALRARGYWFGTFPLWLDEATWAILLVDQPLQDHLIRPIGLMAVTKGLAALFGPSEDKNGYLEWWLDRYRGMTTLPGMRRDYFHSRLFSGSSISTIKSIDRQVWTGLHLLGLWMLVVRRRGRDALLFCAPLLVLSAFNWAGRWPLGIFRTNLFTLPYFAAIAAIAVDRRLPARSSLLSGAAALVPTFLLVLLPLGLFEKSWHSKKYAFTTTSRWPEILERLLETSHEVPSARRETLVIDRGGCDPFLYYTRYHPELSVRYGRPFQQRFESHCVRKARRLNHFLLPALDSAGTRAWIVSARVKSFRKERAKWPATFVVDPRAMVGPTRILSVERR